MNIPSKLKVGGLTYKVKIADEINEDDCAAFIDHQKLTITVEKAEPEAMRHNFLHEMFHAINFEFTEEKVEFLASALYQVIKDNPTIFKGGAKHG